LDGQAPPSVKISQLSDGLVLAPTDQFIIARSGSNNNITSSEIGGPQNALLVTADLSARPNTTPSNTTGLQFTGITGASYAFRFGVAYQSAATTAGLKLSLTFPAVTTQSATVAIPSTTAAVSAVFFGYIVTSGGTVGATSTPVAATTYHAMIEGQIVVSTGGTIQVQHASNTTGTNITVKQGSYGQYWRLA
jgi:hypothetical protein